MTEKIYYYNDLFELLFEDVPANAKLPELPTIEKTFKDGGYYRYNFSSNFAMLSLNSIYFNIDNINDLETATIQLDWFREQLSADDTTQFIVGMHIFPGLFYYDHLEPLWYDDYLQAYLNLTNTY